MIKFPKVHIATSVTNRILNVADGLPDAGSQATRTPEPHVPETEAQSLALDTKLSLAPPGELPGIDQAPDPGATVSGSPLLETILKPGA